MGRGRSPHPPYDLELVALIDHEVVGLNWS